MLDHEFFDLLYQQWALTTGAEDKFYMPEQDTGYYVGGPDSWIVWAVDKEHSKEFVASFDKEVDAEFFAGVHGCIADLIRRLHTAIDEADRLDIERDEAQQDLAAVALENEELQRELNTVGDELAEARSFKDGVGADLWEAERQVEQLQELVRDLQFQLDEVGR